MPFEGKPDAGPFRTVAAFHDWLLSLIPRPDKPTSAGIAFDQQLRASLPDDVPVVFQQADLHPTNVMVHPTEPRVLAVIDFERSGFFPDYWDWVKARSSIDPDNDSGWGDAVAKILDPHEDAEAPHTTVIFGSGTM